VVDIASRQAARAAGRPEPIRSVVPDAEEFEAALDAVPEAPPAGLPRGRGADAKPLRVYPFGVSRNRLEETIGQLGVPATVVRDGRDADLVMTLKNYYRRKPQPIREAEVRGTPVYVLRANTGVQMENVLTGLFPRAAHRLGRSAPAQDIGEQEADGEPQRQRRGEDRLLAALSEAEDAIGSVLGGGPAVALTPQDPHIRRLQHELAERYNVSSRSRGREPHRRVEFFRDGVR
jgi:hypothetical protein